MNRRNQPATCYLEQLRVVRGAQACRRALRAMAANPYRAVRALRQPGLTFPTLFVVRGEIKEFGLENMLGGHTGAALAFCEQKSQKEQANPHTQDLYPVLKWMFETGWDAKGMSQPYDRAIDRAAALLIKRYGDNSILPPLVDLIFLRARESKPIHDLVWSCFAARDPLVLELIANYLRSPEQEAINLACRLLHYNPDFAKTGVRYYDYMKWLTENRPYLYYTGDSMQRTSEPQPFTVDCRAKYVGEGNVQPEPQVIEAFCTVDTRVQQELADYSDKLRRKNPTAWSEWMQKSLQEQLEDLRKAGEGVP